MSRSKKLIFPLAVLLAVGLGCSWIQRYVDESAGSSNTGAANSERSDGSASGVDGPAAHPPSGNPKQDIEEMAGRFLELDLFTARMTTEGATDLTVDMDFIAPDKFRMKTRLPNGQSTEMIAIGKTTYMKIGDRWQKMAMDIGSTMPDMRKAFTKEGLRNFTDVQYEGEETIDGTAAYRYSYSGSVPESENSYTSKIWVARSNGLPVKVSADYASGDLKSMSIVYDYDEKISIEAPIGN